MKQYIVEVFLVGQKVKQFVTTSIDLAESIVSIIEDDVTEVMIKEVTV